MHAADVLVCHHNVLRSLVTAVDDTPAEDTGRRRELVDAFAAEILIHARIEDEIYYPAVRQFTMLVTLAHAEHRQLADQLAAVLRTNVRDAAFADEWRMLVHTFEHHAGEEEADMFPEVAAKLDPEVADALGERLQARLDDLRTSRVSRLRLSATRAALRHL